jgi:hypothetical protein
MMELSSVILSEVEFEYERDTPRSIYTDRARWFEASQGMEIKAGLPHFRNRTPGRCHFRRSVRIQGLPAWVMKRMPALSNAASIRITVETSRPVPTSQTFDKSS